jgi:hypothetical protein
VVDPQRDVAQVANFEPDVEAAIDIMRLLLEETIDHRTLANAQLSMPREASWRRHTAKLRASCVGERDDLPEVRAARGEPLHGRARRDAPVLDHGDAVARAHR